MSRARSAILLAALASLGAGPSQPDLALTSEGSIEGSWTMVFFDENPHIQGYYWVIDKSKIRVIINGKETLERSYTLDLSQTPAELKTSAYRAICKVEGNRLLVCLTYGTTLPQVFKKGHDQHLYDFKRASLPVK